MRIKEARILLWVLGRIIRVDHVDKYKKKEEEDEETERQKREAHGVCRAFQIGECTRGASCKFSHDEQVTVGTGGEHGNLEAVPGLGHTLARNGWTK
ncbi:Zinc finger CCCH domain-containing protein 42 [Glycine soja]|uniref:Zinc finger CCCH domain-containing protein 42 n=1 Tax=Glycine soja TaxID=3848 RepID=A0A445H584_GLYSO|nr:Zinc finger CCCH domain-containing protein 42 [Glycine soja]